MSFFRRAFSAIVNLPRTIAARIVRNDLSSLEEQRSENLAAKRIAALNSETADKQAPPPPIMPDLRTPAKARVGCRVEIVAKPPIETKAVEAKESAAPKVTKEAERPGNQPATPRPSPKKGAITTLAVDIEIEQQLCRAEQELRSKHVPFDDVNRFAPLLAFLRVDAGIKTNPLGGKEEARAYFMMEHVAKHFFVQHKGLSPDDSLASAEAFLSAGAKIPNIMRRLPSRDELTALPGVLTPMATEVPVTKAPITAKEDDRALKSTEKPATTPLIISHPELTPKWLENKMYEALEKNARAAEARGRSYDLRSGLTPAAWGLKILVESDKLKNDEFLGQLEIYVEHIFRDWWKMCDDETIKATAGAWIAYVTNVVLVAHAKGEEPRWDDKAPGLMSPVSPPKKAVAVIPTAPTTAQTRNIVAKKMHEPNLSQKPAAVRRRAEKAAAKAKAETERVEAEKKRLEAEAKAEVEAAQKVVEDAARAQIESEAKAKAKAEAAAKAKAETEAFAELERATAPDPVELVRFMKNGDTHVVLDGVHSFSESQ